MDGCNWYMDVMTLIRITEDHDPWCNDVMIPSSGLCTLAFGETQRGKVRRTSCLPKSSPAHQYHHHYPLFSTFIIPIHIREDTVIDLDGPGPLPPFSVTCYKSSTGFTTAVRSERTNIKSMTVAMNVMMSVVTIIVTKAWQWGDDKSGWVSRARFFSPGDCNC